MGHHACATSDDQGESIDALLAGVHAGAAVCMAHHLRHTQEQTNLQGVDEVVHSADSCPAQLHPGTPAVKQCPIQPGQNGTYHCCVRLTNSLGVNGVGAKGKGRQRHAAAQGRQLSPGSWRCRPNAANPLHPPLTHPIPTYTPAIAQHVDTCATCSSPATKQAVTIMCLLLAATSPLLACWLLMS